LRQQANVNELDIEWICSGMDQHADLTGRHIEQAASSITSNLIHQGR